MRRVSLTVSKLLKRLGYNFPSLVITNESGTSIINPYKDITVKGLLFDYDINYYDDVYLLPTLYETIEWLIIHHNTVIVVDSSFIPDKIGYLNELERLIDIKVRELFMETTISSTIEEQA